jgi:uncharacterized membrane protein (DUF485 family)
MAVTSVELLDHTEVRPDFVDLVKKRLRVALFLSAVMVLEYFGFMALFAFDKPFLGTIIAPNLSLAMILGPALILFSVALCIIYVIWTNCIFDPAVRRLHAEGSAR